MNMLMKQRLFTSRMKITATKVGDLLTADDLNEYVWQGKNYYSHNEPVWQVSVGYFYGDRYVEAATTIKGVPAFLVSGTARVWIRNPNGGWKLFYDSLP